MRMIPFWDSRAVTFVLGWGLSAPLHMFVTMAIKWIHSHCRNHQCLIEHYHRSIQHHLTMTKPCGAHVISTTVFISTTMLQLQLNNPSLHVPGLNKSMFG